MGRAVAGHISALLRPLDASSGGARARGRGGGPAALPACLRGMLGRAPARPARCGSPTARTCGEGRQLWPHKASQRSAQSSVRKLVASRDAHCQTRLRESKPKGEARDGGAIAGAMLTAVAGAAALLQGPDAFADMDLPPSTMPLALGREGLPMHGGARPLPPTEAEPKGPMFDPQVAALVLSLGSGATYSGDATTPKSSGLPSPKSKQRHRTPPVPPPPLM